MNQIFTIIDDNKEMLFYPNRTFSGVMQGAYVLNYFPILASRIRWLVDHEKSLDEVRRIIGLTGSSGGSQKTEEYSNSILPQNGAILGENICWSFWCLQWWH
jgi:hypothetical protein